MGIFVIGLVIFLGVHSVAIVAPGWRADQVSRLGEASWKGLYSGVAALGLGLLIYGYGAARDAPVVLYTPPAALRHLALLLMLPVFPLLMAAYLPGRIKATVKHPMLLAVKLWATAHLLANGMLVDVLLFGGFLVWAIADRVALKRHPHGDPPAAPARPYNDLIAVVIGLGVYAALLLGAHRWLFGVSPLASLQ